MSHTVTEGSTLEHTPPHTLLHTTMDKLANTVSAHTSAWLKMLNVGGAHNQEPRFRKSFLGGNSPAPMYVLVKDHKQVAQGELPKTRPVVAGCSSYNVGMSELLSELLEAVYKAKEDKVGVISSDDFLASLHILNKDLSKKNLKIYDPNNPAHVSGEEDTVTMIASDVVALFPSMQVNNTARICGKMVRKTELSIEDLDVTEMLLYLRLNQDLVTNLKEVEP